MEFMKIRSEQHIPALPLFEFENRKENERVDWSALAGIILVGINAAPEIVQRHGRGRLRIKEIHIN